MKARRKTMHLGASSQIFRNAKKLRENPTKAEEILWEHLRDKKMEGVKFRRQHSMYRTVPDLYAHELKFIIEIDGEYHEDKCQVFVDNEKDKNNAIKGRYTLRITNQDIFNRTEEVLELIRKKVQVLRFLKKQKKSY